MLLPSDSHSHRTIFWSHNVNGLFVELDRFNYTDSQVIFFRDSQRSSYLEHTSCHGDTDNNRVSTIEYSIFNNFKRAWEDGIATTAFLSFILALFDVSSEVIKQVIDNLGSKDLDTLVLSELLGVRCDTHVEG